MTDADTLAVNTLRWASAAREFDVATGDFSQLQVRPPTRNNPSYLAFLNKATGLRVTDFVLHEGEKVSTICTVTLIHNDGEFTPRLKFWKKDKSKAIKAATEEPIPDAPENRMVKAMVDTKEGHRNLWKLINYLQSCTEFSVPQDRFRAIPDDSAQLAEMLKDQDKETLVAMMSKLLSGNLTQADLDLLANRKGQLEEFELLLTNPDYFEDQRRRLGKNTKEEDVWQDFFERNPWIFGYGLNLIACSSFDDGKLERFTTGASAFVGSGKRVDALMRTRGIVSSLLFCEIKTPSAGLLALYRKEDVYRPRDELVGAVAQVQKTADKAVRGLLYVMNPVSAGGRRADFEVATIRPRQVVVVGTTDQFKEADGTLNTEKVSSFEFYRRSVNDVEVITFDELLARAKFIVADRST
ncbi:Shedu immune nuclease family protein [Nocardia gipuzkoensis]|uniref:Shedu immune nuclease family protein n=1 Tax=Nocardia gipuzkoensis TaxID=2749991 RepID=UPI003EE2490A